MEGEFSPFSLSIFIIYQRDTKMAKSKDIFNKEAEITPTPISADEYVVCTATGGGTIVGSKMYRAGEEFILKKSDAAAIASSIEIITDKIVTIDEEGQFFVAAVKLAKKPVDIAV